MGPPAQARIAGEGSGEQDGIHGKEKGERKKKTRQGFPEIQFIIRGFINRGGY